MQIARALVASAALLVGVGATAAARPQLDADGAARLARYDVLTFTDPVPGGIEKSKAVGVFDATAEEVFRTAADYERLSEFAPRVVSSKVIERRGDGHTLVMLASDLPWPVKKAWVYADFVEERLPGDVYRIRFTQVRGSMRRYLGSIVIEPWAGRAPAPPRATVTYELLAEPDTIAPNSLVNRKLRDVAAHYVHALRQRVNELHRLGRLHPIEPPAPDAVTACGSAAPVAIEHVAQRDRLPR